MTCSRFAAASPFLPLRSTHSHQPSEPPAISEKSAVNIEALFYVTLLSDKLFEYHVCAMLLIHNSRNSTGFFVSTLFHGAFPFVCFPTTVSVADTKRPQPSESLLFLQISPSQCSTLPQYRQNIVGIIGMMAVAQIKQTHGQRQAQYMQHVQYVEALMARSKTSKRNKWCVHKVQYISVCIAI